MSQGSLNLLDCDRQGLQDLFASLDEKPFRALQLMKWIYQAGEIDFSRMTNLGKMLQAKLARVAKVQIPEVAMAHQSSDGTWKWLFRLDSGNSIECVFIPETNRGTLCVSTQVGCALDCSFCATAREGFNRNLSTAEIIGQVWLATRLLRQQQVDKPWRISNIVLMGMGEPLANFDNVVKALRIMLDDFGYGLSKRRVTLSTSGIVPAMYRLYEAVDVALAVSLHAPNDALRDQLVPINRKYPIDQLMAACRKYLEGYRKKQITFEYVMLDGVNDYLSHARSLGNLVKGMACKINLIPFNPFTASGYQCSSQRRIDAFKSILTNSGLVTIVRKTRGDDISAACGQLSGSIEDKSRRQLRFAQPRFGEAPMARNIPAEDNGHLRPNLGGS